MSLWQILEKAAFFKTDVKTHKISDRISISSDGTSYTTYGWTTVGSDGFVFTQVGGFSSDGSTRMGSIAIGLGSVFGRNFE